MRIVLFVLLSSTTMLLAQQKELVIQAGTGASSPAGVAFLGGELLGGPTVTGAPYSADAVSESTQTLADGNRVVNKSTSKVYRDSAGRERREQSLPQFGKLTSDNGAPVAIMISDPVVKANYTLDTNNKRAMKVPAPTLPDVAGMGELRNGVFTQTMPAAAGMVTGGQVMVYSARGTGASEGFAPKTEDLGKRLIEGVQAEGTRTTITIPAGQAGNDRPMEIVSERWYSPELQVVIMSKHSDPRMGETVYRLTNLSRVEPAPSLFEIPPGYQVNDMMQKLKIVDRDLKNDE